MMQKGVTWNTGRVFSGDDREPVFSFDLLPDRRPVLTRPSSTCSSTTSRNTSSTLLDETPLTQLRWQSRVSGVRQHPRSRRDHVETPDGAYTVTADYLIAADGSRSTGPRDCSVSSS